MKKLFATLVLFASLALTACGGGNGGGTSKVSSTKHTHSWGDWTETTPATCETKGSKERVCACGEKQTQEIAALNHDWDEGTITTPATCSTPGVKTFKCKRAGCNAEKREEIKADHTWDAGTPVEGKDSEAAYTLFSCTKCGAKKIEFVAKQGEGKATISGSLKADSTYPDYMKLGTNGDSISYSFSSQVGGNAKVYQRGVMDYWHDGNNENQARNYYSGKNSTDGNFEFTVNGNVVDYSWSRDFTYEDMLPGEYTGTYSPLGDALIGDCVINAGDNTITYKRTESYNMLIKDFVIVIDSPQA